MTTADALETTAEGLADATRVGLFVALLGLPLLSLTTRVLPVDVPQLASVVSQWVLLACVLIVTVRWEGRSLRSIGIRRPERIDVAYLLVATVLGFLALAATGPVVDAFGLQQADQSGLGVAETGVGLALLSAVTVGIVEELCYRGYAIERLEEYTGRAVLAGGISWAVFTLAHAASWHLGDLLQVALAALVFTLVYLRRRSLVPVVGAHVLIWLVGILGVIYG